ncbi:F-box/kelch-repeat protein At3g23880-like [Arachis stenosperma]|uniref:F-box/kelch-repeat protein At3g23880-like n=1 Tax=Arachis stenosperma TaxID=217475 RepID=UPI0025AC47C9|nr:F-box/kelch-repeat protein At3g23880-like [Arachis stenosperma]
MEQPRDYYERERKRKSKPLRVTINAPKRLLSSTVTQSQPLPFLPDELIREILLRLPARSLLRLRRVCTSWESLISSSQFAKDHLQHSTAADPSLSGPRVAYHHSCHYGFGDFSLRSLIENSSKPTEVVLFEERRNYMVIGSCNGLLCLLFDVGFNTCVRLWNPCTGLLTTLSVECGNFLSVRGFGYDHVNDKYKFVVIVKHTGKYTTRIYTFCRNPSKRAIQGIPFSSIKGDGKGVFVPGTATLNWIRSHAILGCLVFSLDLVKETFSEFSLPLNDPDDKTFIFPQLCVLRNCLAYCFNHEKTHWFVWVMKEYGVPKSWTKLAVIPCHPCLSNYHFRPLYIWGNNILVAVALTSKIVLFNLDNCSFEFPQRAVWLEYGVKARAAASVPGFEYLKEKKKIGKNLKRGLLTASNGEVSEIDVTDIGTLERKKVLQRLVGTAEEDNEKFLLKLRERIDSYLNYLHILSSQKKQVTILKDTSGIVRPCPPSSGKTTLLLALAGKLGLDLKVSGRVTYNGHEMNEFVPQRTAIYISQNDVHIGEMTVRETLAFSARCQGVGSRFG